MHSQTFIQTNHGISFPFVGPKLQRQRDLINRDSEHEEKDSQDEQLTASSDSKQ